ncbi:MAG: hypothetical protein DWQ02_03690, partial [Bacteroidetes bacterium]
MLLLIKKIIVMKTIEKFLLTLCLLLIFEGPSIGQNCSGATAQTDLDANNVRARIAQGGRLWWDGADGKYIFPATDVISSEEVSALFAGGFWIA